MDDPHLNPPQPSGFTRFFRRAGESTTAFFQRTKLSTGSSSILVGGFIGASATAGEIIERGISGQPINIWHGVKFLFYFTLSACYAYNLYKVDPNAAKPTRLE